MLDRGLRPLGHASGDEESDDDDERPAEAEQQSVGSSHVRRREVQVVGIGSGSERVVEVHGVLGEDRDEGQ